MKLTFIDCAGELFAKDLHQDPLADEAWKTFETAGVMMFVLPIWALFPEGSAMKPAVLPTPGTHGKPGDWDLRQLTLMQFRKILGNYHRIRQESETAGRKLPRPRVILALTQADDRRSALGALKERWIEDYVDNSRARLKQLGRISGPTRYLAAARTTSEYLRQEFAAIQDRGIADILNDLEIDGNRAWLIPMTAIDGATLAGKEAGTTTPTDDPVPAHVELPLLLALCEAHNALM
jgi:hypothetical protein